MGKKGKNKKRLMSGTDIALSILAALGGSVLFVTIVAVAGSIMSQDSVRSTTAEATSAQPSYYGTLPSRAPTQPPTPEPVESIGPNDMDTPEPAQTPPEATPDTLAPAPSRAPTPAGATTAQNTGPVVSIGPTAPPARQTQAPVQTGGTGTVRNNDDTYTHDFSNGRMLGTVNSDKYHYRDCRAAKTIPPENCVWYDSEDEAKADGRSRCGICWR